MDASVQLEVAGYSEKLPLLVKKIIERMRNLTISEERFQVLKEQVGPA